MECLLVSSALIAAPGFW